MFNFVEKEVFPYYVFGKIKIPLAFGHMRLLNVVLITEFGVFICLFSPESRYFLQRE
jgi:hypothetical protein